MEKMEKKRMTFESRETIISSQTGEIIENRVNSTVLIDKEPDYVKLYLADIMTLSNLPKSGNALLMALLRKANYQNEIVIVKSIRDEICFDLKVADVTFRKAIDQFIYKGILTKKNKNVYIANPYLFGKGSWQNIQYIRLTVEYNSKGRFLIRDEHQVNSLQRSIEFE